MQRELDSVSEAAQRADEQLRCVQALEFQVHNQMTHSARTEKEIHLHYRSSLRLCGQINLYSRWMKSWFWHLEPPWAYYSQIGSVKLMCFDAKIALDLPLSYTIHWKQISCTGKRCLRNMLIGLLLQSCKINRCQIISRNAEDELVETANERDQLLPQNKELAWQNRHLERQMQELKDSCEAFEQVKGVALVFWKAHIV